MVVFFVEIASADDAVVAELDVVRVRVREVPDLHGLNPRSRKAL
jgi:hypothetical protein